MLTHCSASNRLIVRSVGVWLRITGGTGKHLKKHIKTSVLLLPDATQVRNAGCVARRSTRGKDPSVGLDRPSGGGGGASAGSGDRPIRHGVSTGVAASN